MHTAPSRIDDLLDATGSNDHLRGQIAFILEIDKLKNIMRRNYILGGERFENSAEHSWSLALMAVLLAEHANEPVDVARVVKMVLVHDIVEIDAGDTYCYDADAHDDKQAREQRAADRIFGLLPDHQRDECRALWDEFEARGTPNAKFANAIDRLLPLMQNYQAYGRSWQANHVRADQVRERMVPVAESSEVLAQFVDAIIGRAVHEGYLQ